MLSFQANPEHLQALLGEQVVKTPQETPQETPDMIIEALKVDSSLTGVVIARQIGKSESAVKRAIKKLRESDRLERIGPTKSGHWKVLEKKE